MARLAQLVEQVQKGRDVRANLISIRENISDEALRRSFVNLLGGDYTFLYRLLEHEDPKVRRNAALILGRAAGEEALPALLRAWEAEETLFIREDYLKAISGMDYSACLPQLKARIAALEQTADPVVKNEDASGEEPEQALWDNSKHLLAELSLLRGMVAGYEKEQHRRYRPARLFPAPDVMLLTNRLHAEVTARQITVGNVRLMRGALYVKGADLKELFAIRTWTELLFPIPGARPVSGSEKEIAQQLHVLKIGNYLNYLHEESAQPFRYRIEVKSRTLPREKRGEWIRRIARRLDLLERGVLQNTDSDYEVELRLIERSDGSWQPILKLFTLADERFAYRKETTAQSTSAPLSALAVELARPYLKEGAQVLDPFCGAGTLLIERSLALAAEPLYGVDRYLEAVEKARRNTEGMRHFYFINRDFFDFVHDYRFDELITELPHLTREESGAFALRFLEKAKTLLKREAVLAVLTDAAKELEKAAAKSGYHIQEQWLLNERTQTQLVILCPN